MKLTRYYFTSDQLDDLETFEEELEREGIVTEQIHVLTADCRGAALHRHLHAVTSFMKVDVVHSTLIGAACGACLALLGLLTAYWAGWYGGQAGWTPFVFLAVVMLGFATWQGGLWGVQTRNAHFRRFEAAVQEGRHVFFVDAAARDRAPIEKVAARHSGLSFAGFDRGAPGWLVFSQHRVTHFFTHVFP
jgi:hypothetical protein